MPTGALTSKHKVAKGNIKGRKKGILWWLSVLKIQQSLLWLRLLLWHGFGPWPGKFFHAAGTNRKKKKKKDKRRERLKLITLGNLCCI